MKVAHSLMLRGIATAKKKNDRIDGNKIALNQSLYPMGYTRDSGAKVGTLVWRHQ